MAKVRYNNPREHFNPRNHERLDGAELLRSIKADTEPVREFDAPTIPLHTKPKKNYGSKKPRK